MSARHLTLALAMAASALVSSTTAPAATVEPQPFLAALQQLLDATDYLGTPFSAGEKKALAECMAQHDDTAVEKARGILDEHCLFIVNVNPEQRVKVAQGAAKPELDEAGWRQFLVRVDNDAGVTAKLQVSSP